MGNSEDSTRPLRYTSWAWPRYYYTTSTTTHPNVAISYTRLRFKRAQLRPTLTAGATIFATLMPRNTTANIFSIRATK